MTKRERHAAIMEMLMQQNQLSVSYMSEVLKVSSVTIRKDLLELEAERKLYRSYGKAVLINPYENPVQNSKERLCIDEKRLIGRLAASMISTNDSVIMACGTTINALSRVIDGDKPMTVVTSSLQVAETLSRHKMVQIIQMGGILRHGSMSVVGSYAESILRDFYCSKLFIGVEGIDVEFGITTTDIREASLNRRMMHSAQKTIVLADSTKFGRRGFSKICDMSDVDLIITDSHVKPAVVKQIEEMGVEMVIATDELVDSLGDNE